MDLKRVETPKKMDTARKNFIDLFERRKSRKKENPVYDQVYHDGMKWLDSLQGEGVSPGEIQLQIPDEFWDSSFRTHNSNLLGT